MIIIPAVDIKDRKCVQLIQGDPKKKLVELEDPLKVAERWVDEGAEMIHVVDLDRAIYQRDTNVDIVKEIVSTLEVPVQVGGGIRSVEDGIDLIDAGAYRVILGTSAVKNPKIVEELSKEVGKKRVMVALDSKEGKVVIKGWKERTEYSPVDIGKILEKKGAGSILFTDVDVEGLLRGVKIETVKILVDELNIPVVASGGVSTYEDIIKLKDIGVEGIVIGSALYKNLLNLKKCIEISKGG
ncbi:MAG TPA: 1-(5-phosphoribosyl)-5-[(5-phosphoribosylamino)methylideneamino]imidazole-4-carboxamide isomerase [Methanothermococcus okinawensis]|uniref:1-(5-phosphoribosyl)-5-[(5-phosphoribosylamino)methylideneamino] imidazole-4-carboxamide isomerase n=1 Tax=Methanofervidicoccus abyssi TaxID=2082189 RepID=A0A401HPD9_9EURY|nr:1-(5-phosphoribosyl)-5-[(5-phosphoribosylamino)methylideneamino]imidazole-4-carboxamide isomerase [Methanofervidicoccus abyssi]GBF36099.1 phosphoribosylformimino-5-aminoimidazole carboxamide ribotide isomerase [Methanofervidicoccus abyssi]HIP16549.1 1-(5-phosphoribosyl)-5-[(5-phosphoribosylamino)methylideneamino]imidazole-4-carboxamide isomerase [Methanothermococcus okinawensis]HIP34786.1 1-(5-phosphoribosyl)-5-[(5-phosphoribosylamino)methylideneamino]imidazole-4-carboxamide isomerase [Methan